MFNPFADVADSGSADDELVERGDRSALEKLVTIVRMCERWLAASGLPFCCRREAGVVADGDFAEARTTWR